MIFKFSWFGITIQMPKIHEIQVTKWKNMRGLHRNLALVMFWTKMQILDKIYSTSFCAYFVQQSAVGKCNIIFLFSIHTPCELHKLLVKIKILWFTITMDLDASIIGSIIQLYCVLQWCFINVKLQIIFLINAL